MKSTPIIYELGSEFYEVVQPASFPKADLRYFNPDLVALLTPQKTPEDFLRKHFWKFDPFENNISQPLALKYHGHQFRHYNPDLGDGRGFLAAQFEHAGIFYDFGTKGSGPTPYSRRGDGRLTLKGAFREALATELLESLGVNTSRTFCFFETGENLVRGDEPSPTRSAVLTRFSQGHIRFGTFQRLAFLGEVENMRKLAAYSLKYYYHLEVEPASVASTLFNLCAQRTAELAAQMMMAGFVHGVLNTDNMNISGELFDYGPYRFLPIYDVDFTAAYFDEQGLYSFGRQPESFAWGLEQLGLCLKMLDPEIQVKAAIELYAETFHTSVRKNFLRRLNLKSRTEAEDHELLANFFQFLESEKLPFEQLFFDLYGGANPARLRASARATAYDLASFKNLQAAIEKYEVADSSRMNHPYWDGPKPETLIIDELESLWQPIQTRDDWAPFHQKIQNIRSFRGLYRELL